MRTRLLAPLAAVLLLPATVLAQAPAKLGFQGQLKNPNGSPMTGTVSVTFSLFPTAIGGAALWSETQSLALSSGFYATQLGSVAALPLAAFDGSERYVEVSVGGTALSPRQRIGSVAYALRAGAAPVARDSTLVGDGASTSTPLGINASQVQRRVTGSCGAGAYLQSINQDGTAACGTDKDTTYSAGGGLSLSGTTFSLTSGCASGQLLKWNGSTWACANDVDTDTNTTYSAGSGLSLSGTTFSLTSGCASGQVLKWNGSAWGCAADDTVAAGSNSYIQNQSASSQSASFSIAGTASVGSNVGIGTAPGSERLQVAGNIALSGASPSYRVTNVAPPRADYPSDVATKAYVDARGPGGTAVTAALDGATTGTTSAPSKYQSFTPVADQLATAISIKVSTGGYCTATDEWGDCISYAYDPISACIYDATAAGAPGTPMTASAVSPALDGTMKYVQVVLVAPLALRGGTKYVLRVGAGGSCSGSTGRSWTWALSAADIYPGGQSEASSATDYLFSIQGDPGLMLGAIDSATTGTTSAPAKYQSFIPPSDMLASALSVKVSTGGYCTATDEWGDCISYAYDPVAACLFDTTSAGAPGTQLTSSAVAATDGTMKYVRIPLGTALALRGGTKYALKVGAGSNCNGSTGRNWTWALSPADVLVNPPGQQSDVSATRDYVFFIDTSRSPANSRSVMELEQGYTCGGYGTYPANCPTGWIQAGMHNVIRGGATSSNSCIRSCVVSARCAVLYLDQGYTCGGYGTYPANCPTGWAQAGMHNVIRGGAGYSNSCVRACYLCE